MTNVYNGIKALIENCITPTPEKIYKGWQNRTTLDSSQNYCVISLLDSERVGTNVHSYADYIDSVSTLYKHNVQVDFVGADSAMQAARLAAIARDGAAVNFLADYGISAIGCDGFSAAPTVLQKQWVTRYIVTLALTQWVATELPVDDFTGVNLNLENVDVHHKEQ